MIAITKIFFRIKYFVRIYMVAYKTPKELHVYSHIQFLHLTLRVVHATNLICYKRLIPSGF
jgi:hypothetical protein